MFVYDSTYQHGMNIVDELIYSEPTQQEQLELALDAVRGHLLPILRLTTPAILVLALSVSGYITICLPTLFETKASETKAQVSETLTYVLGGLLIALIEFFGVAYVSSEYRDAYVFAILIFVLLFKPEGVLGKATVEKV